jgi:hypothetical protein
MVSFSSCDAHDHFQVSNLAKIYMKDDQMDEINNIVPSYELQLG